MGSEMCIRDRNTPAEYTQWSTIGDLKNQAYYVKTYDDPVLRGVSFKDLDLDAKDMVTIQMHPKLEPASLIEKK